MPTPSPPCIGLRRPSRCFATSLPHRRKCSGRTTNTRYSRELALVADLVDQHRDEEAAAMGLPVARSLEALLGADNLYAMSAWNSYGGAACGSHQEDQGLAALRRVAAARQRLYPPGTWVISSSTTGDWRMPVPHASVRRIRIHHAGCRRGTRSRPRTQLQSDSGRLSRVTRSVLHDGQGR